MHAHAPYICPCRVVGWQNAEKANWQLCLFAADNLANLEYNNMEEVSLAVAKIGTLASSRATKLVLVSS